MTRISKKISLKSLGIQLNYAVVQELPFKHDSYLKLEDLPTIRTYNTVHDLSITELLTTKMLEEIKLRSVISSDFKLNAWSWDAPKIASEVLLRNYCNIIQQDSNNVRKHRYNKPTIYIKDILSDFNPNFKLKVFQDLYTRILESKNAFNEQLLVTENNTNIRLSYGIGGLHSVNENEKYFSNVDTQVVTSDAASLYPNLIINYKCIRFPEVLQEYTDVMKQRLIAKANKEKVKDTFYKLILNSISGLLDMEHSWLYYPEGALRLRLIGQLFLTKLIEVCILNNWKVISANTDGKRNMPLITVM